MKVPQANAGDLYRENSSADRQGWVEVTLQKAGECARGSYIHFKEPDEERPRSVTTAGSE